MAIRAAVLAPELPDRRTYMAFSGRSWATKHIVQVTFSSRKSGYTGIREALTTITGTREREFMWYILSAFENRE
jgi:hypothetical protein